MQERLKKFTREPGRIRPRQLTPRAIEILITVIRFRFLPSSWLVRLVLGNTRVTLDHLQHLYHRKLLNRFQLKQNSEFVYHIDEPNTLRLLMEQGFEPTEQMHEWVRTHRERDYTGAVRTGEHGQLFFVEHELMVSRFHAMLECACRDSAGSVVLERWAQGSVLTSSVQTPALKYYPRENEWLEKDGYERLPHCPDGFFTLGFPNEPEGQRRAHYFYEADRGTMNTTDMKKKFRAHFHFVVKQRKHEKVYQIRRVRAVLVETIRTKRADELRETAKHPIVSGNTPSPLFLFTTAELFSKPQETKENGRLVQRPLYLCDPGVIFKRIWAPPDEDRLVSILD